MCIVQPILTLAPHITAAAHLLRALAVLAQLAVLQIATPCYNRVRPRLATQFHNAISATTILNPIKANATPRPAPPTRIRDISRHHQNEKTRELCT